MASADDDDDPSPEWETEGGATIVDGVVVHDLDANTAPHSVERLPGYEIGFRAGTERKAKVCYKEGQEDAMGALQSILLEKGLSNDETLHIVLAVRKRLTPI